MNQATPDTPLREVLYAFAIAKATPDADLLEEYVRRYPNYAAALTDFAIDLIVDLGRGNDEHAPDVGAPAMTPTVSRVMSRFHSRLYAAHCLGAAEAIAQVVMGTGDLANARLIAAAPELLEALNVLKVDYAESEGCYCGQLLDGTCGYCKATTAIAHAEGAETPVRHKTENSSEVAVRHETENTEGEV